MNNIVSEFRVLSAIMLWPVLACIWTITLPPIVPMQMRGKMPAKPVIGRYGYTSGFE